MKGSRRVIEETEIRRILNQIIRSTCPTGKQQVHRRLHDESDGTEMGVLEVVVSIDGDLWVKTSKNTEGGYMLRFRDDGDGGASPRVHNALRLLAWAIMIDNEEEPPRRASESRIL